MCHGKTCPSVFPYDERVPFCCRVEQDWCCCLLCCPGWTGRHCSEDVAECDLQTCQHGECQELPGLYFCDCTGTGFEGEGRLLLCHVDVVLALPSYPHCTLWCGWGVDITQYPHCTLWCGWGVDITQYPQCALSCGWGVGIAQLPPLYLVVWIRCGHYTVPPMCLVVWIRCRHYTVPPMCLVVWMRCRHCPVPPTVHCRVYEV